MKKINIQLTNIVLLSVCNIAIASADSHSDWYVKGLISSTNVSDIDTTSREQVAGANRSVRLNSDNDFGWGVAVGRTVHETNKGKWDIELNYSQSDHDIDSINFNGNNFTASANTAAGDVDISTFGLSGIYNFNVGKKVTPYLGIGIGITTADIDVVYGGSVGAAAGQPPFINDEDSAFSIQYIAGLDLELSNNVSGFVEYKYLSVDDISVNRLGGGPGGLATTSQEGDFDTSTISVGLKYHY